MRDRLEVESASDDHLVTHRSMTSREALIAAAVRFLRHPRVSRATCSQQREFLLQKGLTAAEVDEALYRALNALNKAWKAVWFLPSMGSASPLFSALIRRYSWLALVYDVCRCLLVFSGGGYVIFFVVKHYVIPWLTGRPRAPPPPSPISADQLKQKLDSVQKQLEEERSAAAIARERINTDCSEIRTHIRQLNNDLTAVKSLVLSRKQFPSLPTVPPLPDSVSQSISQSPASVPLWQLQSPAPGDVEGMPGDESPPAGGMIGPGPEPAQTGKAGSSSSSSADIVLVSEQNSDELSDS